MPRIRAYHCIAVMCLKCIQNGAIERAIWMPFLLKANQQYQSSSISLRRGKVLNTRGLKYSEIYRREQCTVNLSTYFAEINFWVDYGR